MKLTIENNKEALKRYRHVKPAPSWGGANCSARCPGTTRNCTLRRGHSGPHVSHGFLNRVLAVWDKGAGSDVGLERKPAKPPKSHRRAERGPSGRKSGGSALSPPRPSSGGLTALKAILGDLARRLPAMEDTVLLILALSMAAFAVRWILLIFGG